MSSFKPTPPFKKKRGNKTKATKPKAPRGKSFKNLSLPELVERLEKTTRREQIEKLTWYIEQKAKEEGIL